MGDGVEFDIKGLDSLLGKLAAVTYDLKRKGGRSALRRAAQLVADKAKEGAEKLDDSATGRSIAKNIALRWNGRLFKQTGNLGFRVGVMKGAVLAKRGERPDLSAAGPTPHWRLLEFGTEKMQASPFMRSALADNINAATETFVSEYEKAIDRALKRATSKAAK